ncbi:MAG: hypothetical protein U0232_33210 [Thermomicrobiales bacterium]
MSRIRQHPWRAIPLAILLVLAACLLLVVGVRSVRAYQGMRNEQRVRAGEAVGVRPWMTIPYIARVYGVPEDELFRALGIANTEQHRRVPLQVLAREERRDLSADIARLNAEIDARHPTPATPQRVP